MDERDRKYSWVEKLVLFVHQITSNKLSGVSLEVFCVLLESNREFHIQ